MSWSSVTGVVPAWLAVQWWRRRIQEARINRELGRLNRDPHAISTQLSPALHRLVEQAHLLRLQMETPIRRVRKPLWRETPWARRERCELYDRSITELRRAIWEWLLQFRRLDGHDRAVLESLGVRPGRLAKILFGALDRTDDVWEEGMYARSPDLDRIYDEVRIAIGELLQFERALGTGGASPYRAA